MYTLYLKLTLILVFSTSNSELLYSNNHTIIKIFKFFTHLTRLHNASRSLSIFKEKNFSQIFQWNMLANKEAYSIGERNCQIMNEVS